MKFLKRVPALGLLVVLCASQAFAQAPSPEAVARANDLLEDGKKLVQLGRYEAAVEKFQASLAKYTQAKTLLNLGDCYERMERYALARSAFRDAAAEAQLKRDVPRHREAERRRSKAEMLAPRLRLEIGKDARLPQLQLSFDALKLSPADWELPFYLDLRRDYVLVAEAPGCSTWRSSLRPMAPSVEHVIVVPVLSCGLAPADAGTPVPVDAGQVGAQEASVAPPPPPDAGTNANVGEAPRIRWPAYVLGGLSLAALGVGTYFGISAMSKRADVESMCPSLALCNPQGKSLNDDAIRYADISTIVLGAAAVGLATSVVLYFVGPRESRPVKDGGARSGGLRSLTIVPSVGTSGGTIDATMRF